MTSRKSGLGVQSNSQEPTSSMNSGENKEGNLENLFLRAQQPIALRLKKSRGINWWKEKNLTSYFYSILYIPSHKRLAAVTLIIPTALWNKIMRIFLNNVHWHQRK
jgi:hypothetical protein